MRTLTIGADNKEAVDAAQVEIFMTLSNQQQQVQQLYNASATSLHVIVPDDKVGLIIGKGGLTVKDIQNRLNVKVVIPQQADAGTNPPVRTIRYRLCVRVGSPLRIPLPPGGGDGSCFYSPIQHIRDKGDTFSSLIFS